ncbi:MAG: T9SS type A sorting domain-containing protein [Bacteroidetes bacterium]|nr:T9SS type A sorting domain-containing protein [Bacteroidota bacterium]
MKFLNAFIFFLLLSLTSAEAQNTAVYVSSGGTNAIIKYDENGENHEVVVAANSGGLSWPQDIVFLEEDTLMLVPSLNNGLIKKYHAETGEYLGNFADLNTGAGPTRMKIGPDGLLYLLQWGGPANPYNTLRYNLDGTFVDAFTSVGVPNAIGMDWDADGNFYVSAYNGSYVRKYDSDGNDLGLFIDSNLQGPTNIWFDDNGDLLVVNYLGNDVARFNSDGEYQGSFLTGLTYAEGVAILDDGSILIGDGGTNDVRRYDSEGAFIEVFIDGSQSGLSTPNAIILREVEDMNSSVKEQAITNKPIITPTIGQEFYLTNNIPLSGIQSVTIFNMDGTLIQRSIKPGAWHWDASNLAAGSYVIKIEMKDGKAQSQMVQVTK